MAVHHFPRTALAQSIVAELQGESLVTTASATLLVAAPRRTGKSSFLLRDLMPAFPPTLATVIYVDLWSAPNTNPAILIAEALGKALAEAQSWFTRTIANSGLADISVPGMLKVDVSKIGKADGKTLTAVLLELKRVSKKSIVLIIDEAQHALTTEDGVAAMQALKAAREILNSQGTVRSLMLIMSGSDRDKLVRLVTGTTAPFVGSRVTPMPLLSKDFTDHVADRIEQEFAQLKPVDRAKLFTAFKLFGSRPELFSQAIGDALNPLTGDASQRLEDAVLVAAEQRRREDEKAYEAVYLSLDPLEQAAVDWMLQSGPNPSMTSADAKLFYEQRTGQPMKQVQSIQPVMKRLRDREPPVMWRAGVGMFELQDNGMVDWYKKHVAAGTWPPKSSGPAPTIVTSLAAADEDGGDTEGPPSL